MNHHLSSHCVWKHNLGQFFSISPLCKLKINFRCQIGCICRDKRVCSLCVCLSEKLCVEFRQFHEQLVSAFSLGSFFSQSSFCVSSLWCVDASRLSLDTSNDCSFWKSHASFCYNYTKAVTLVKSNRCIWLADALHFAKMKKQNRCCWVVVMF